MDSIHLIALGIIATLGIIIYQDLRYRILDVKYAILLLALCCWYNYKHPVLNYKSILFIVAFISINIALLFLYFSLKKKRLFNPVDTKIGLGDIVFFLAITPLFLLRQYILFFISGLLFSLLLSLAIKWITKQDKPLPLAGYLSIYLSSIFILNFIFNKTFLDLGA